MDFPTTSWTLIDRFRLGDEAALQQFLEVYRPSIIEAFRLVLSPDQRQNAEDFAHSFISDKFLTGDLLSNLDQGQGKLRSYLLTAIKNYLSNHYRKRSAQKREGSYPHTTFENLQNEPLMQDPDFSKYDRLWAKASLMKALEAMERSWKLRKREEQFIALRDWYFAGGFTISERVEFPSNSQLSEITKQRRAYQFKTDLHRELSKIIAMTVGCDSDQRNEIRYLLSILAGLANEAN